MPRRRSPLNAIVGSVLVVLAALAWALQGEAWDAGSEDPSAPSQPAAPRAMDLPAGASPHDEDPAAGERGLPPPTLPSPIAAEAAALEAAPPASVVITPGRACDRSWRLSFEDGDGRVVARAVAAAGEPISLQVPPGAYLAVADYPHQAGEGPPPCSGRYAARFDVELASGEQVQRHLNLFDAGCLSGRVVSARDGAPITERHLVLQCRALPPAELRRPTDGSVAVDIKASVRALPEGGFVVEEIDLNSLWNGLAEARRPPREPGAPQAPTRVNATDSRLRALFDPFALKELLASDQTLSRKQRHAMEAVAYWAGWARWEAIMKGEVEPTDSDELLSQGLMELIEAAQLALDEDPPAASATPPPSPDSDRWPPTLQIRFVATALDHGPLVTPWRDWAPCDELDELVLELVPLVQVTGRVRQRLTGEPVALAMVRVEELADARALADPDDPPVTKGGPTPRNESAHTEPSGSYHLTAAGARRVQLVVTAEGFRPWRSPITWLPNTGGGVLIDGLLEAE